MFNEEMVDKLLSLDRDGFVVTKDASYILYLFDREQHFEVRLEHQFIDRYDRKLNSIYLEHFDIPRDHSPKKYLLEMLNERGLLVGGKTQL